MVLIIKAGENISKDLDLIATQMVNMDTNQTIYDEKGKAKAFDTEDAKRTPFNVYKHNSVEFEFQLAFGVVVMYINSNHDTNYSELIASAIDALGVPKSFKHVNSKYTNVHTLVKEPIINRDTAFGIRKCDNRKCFRKIITDTYSVRKEMSSSNLNFLWLVLVKSRDNFRGSYLKIEEVDRDSMSEAYLNKSICTIIYDGIGMFDVPTMTKQIDYPSLTQYAMFKQKQIIHEPLYISWVGGLSYELYYQFTKKSPTLSLLDNNTSVRNSITQNHNIYSSVRKLIAGEQKLKRLNPDKPFEAQLLEPFDYEKQEEDENVLVDEGKPKYLNDVCFITKIPLWGPFYICTIKNATHEFNIAVAPTTVHTTYVVESRASTIETYINSLGTDIKLLKIYTGEHPRSFLDVLDMLDINPVKKNIMRCIHLYGAYSDSNDLGNSLASRPGTASRNYFVVDRDTDQIYLGLSGINDGHVAIYQGTRTVLFRVINVDSINITPDPIAFPDLQVEE